MQTYKPSKTPDMPYSEPGQLDYMLILWEVSEACAASKKRRREHVLNYIPLFL